MSRYQKKLKEIEASIIGKKVGKLTVQKYSHNKNQHHYWICQCECGHHKTVETKNINAGRVQSCGCLRNKAKHSTLPQKALIMDRTSIRKYVFDYHGKRYTIAEAAAKFNIGVTTLRYRLLHNWPVEVALEIVEIAAKRTLKSTQQYKAIGVVNYKVRCKTIIRPEYCQSPSCQNPAKYATHPHGYENPLDILWLCSKCHGNKLAIPITCQGVTKSMREWAEVIGLSPSGLRNRLETMTMEEAIAKGKSNRQKTKGGVSPLGTVM